MRSSLRLLTAALVVGACVATAGINVSAANAYPSWDDVQNAKNNEAAKTTQMAELQGYITTIQSELDVVTEKAQAAGEVYSAAVTKFDEADVRYNQLIASAAEAQAQADKATTEAGRLAAQLYRSGGNDMSIGLFLDGGTNADELLSKLGNMSKMVERSAQVYDTAKASQNEAQSLADQAKVAKVERERLKAEADVAMQAAVAAQQVVADKLAANQSDLNTLRAQLAALQDETVRTVAGYEQGVAEAIKRAQEEAAQRGIDVSDSGWTIPSEGRIVDYYGGRNPVWTPSGWTSSWHHGIDIGSRCGWNIYAVSGGTVTYAGWYGGYGNFLRVDHGGGITSSYAHIVSGGILVEYGQFVAPGQVIAEVGSTGYSTGCHLHFEIRQWGSSLDPLPFLRDRGVGI
jgi:murein DD-endopeptidase MepM/ murein hydrolase activator NlpD